MPSTALRSAPATTAGPERPFERRATTAAIVQWWLVLTALATVGLYATSGGLASLWTPAGFADALLSRIALAFPFAAFAGGLAASRLPRPSALPALLPRVLALGIVAYGSGAILSPMAEVRRAGSAGIDVAATFPFGPDTPLGLTRLERAVRAHPPDRYSLSTDEPLRRPPNWLRYQIHVPFAVTSLALPMALLGLTVGRLTHALDPPRRRHARWGAGIASASLYLPAAVAGSSWVRSSLEHSAAVGAWLPLAVPTAAWLLLGTALRRREARGLHAPPVPRV